jgi:hypothetical protein
VGQSLFEHQCKLVTALPYASFRLILPGRETNVWSIPLDLCHIPVAIICYPHIFQTPRDRCFCRTLDWDSALVAATWRYRVPVVLRWTKPKLFPTTQASLIEVLRRTSPSYNYCSSDSAITNFPVPQALLSRNQQQAGLFTRTDGLTMTTMMTVFRLKNIRTKIRGVCAMKKKIECIRTLCMIVKLYYQHSQP